MFIQVKNFAVEGINKINNGVQFIVSKDGDYTTFEFSTITLKFYHTFGRKMKMPKYLAKELISLACSKGVAFMTETEREDALQNL